MGNSASKSDTKPETSTPKPETSTPKPETTPSLPAPSELNPELEAHNGGQPLQANLDPHGKQRSKFLTNCKEQHAASLQCIQDNYDNRSACEPFFAAYKKCRKEERERHLKENAKHVKWWS